MSHRSTSGHTTGMVVLLLLVVSVAGAWNYHRNWQIEQQSEGVRPYASYAAKDLEALRDAYKSELEQVRAEFDRARSQRVRPQKNTGSMSGNVTQFEKTARASSAIRDAAGGVADREGQIAELDRELEIRARFGEGVMRHVKRLTTI